MTRFAFIPHAFILIVALESDSCSGSCCCDRCRNHCLFYPTQTKSDAPDLKFTEFTPDRVDIRVGESTRILFNVQNLETRPITDAQVIIVIEPSGYQSYLTIQNQTVQLPDLHSRDARTGQIQVVINAAGAPAKEAVYTVKGLLFIEGNQSDVREFELRVRQQ